MKKQQFRIGGWIYNYIFDISKAPVSQMISGSADPNSPIQFSITDFLIDQSGIIWVGTDWGGLYKYDPFSAFSQYHPGVEDIRKNTDSNLRVVFEDSRGDLWLAADNIYRCDRRTGKTNLILSRADFDDTRN